MQRIQSNFDKQAFMKFLGAEIVRIERGTVTIACPKREDLTQQNGFFHAGVLTSIADSACGYSALTVMREGADVLTVEFKVNLLRPAVADRIIATGTVLKAGRTLVVCEGTVTDDANAEIYAKMVGTMIVKER
ncbi:MAG: PaaI family thioesterase [Acidobacteria bacterium]|nr:PaaI family thioesterase [Acidobacteriota bacterium]